MLARRDTIILQRLLITLPSFLLEDVISVIYLTLGKTVFVWYSNQREKIRSSLREKAAPRKYREGKIMLRQCRFIQLSLVGTFLICLFVGAYLFVWKRFAKANPPVTVVKHSVETNPDEVLKYWTADKMRDAKPVNLPSVDTLDQNKQPPQRPGA